MSFDPATLAAVASGIGTVISAVGSIQQGNAAKAAADYNAAVARNNAIAARQTAAANAKRQERLARKRQGTIRANVGASGTELLGGSAMDVLEDSAMEEELERLSILHGGEVQARGFEADARLEKARGAAAQRSGYMSAGSTLLMGGAKAAKGFNLGGGGGDAKLYSSNLSYNSQVGWNSGVG